MITQKAQPARLLILTRLGVGVYDPQWWDSRLGLFKAITLPSISRFKDLNLKWVLLLDSDLPEDIYEKIRFEVFAAGAQDFVEFQFVANNLRIQEATLSAIRSFSFPSERIILFMIDDDDAVSADFFDNVFEEVGRAISKPQVISFSNGVAVNAPDLTFGRLVYPSILCNTAFYGTLSELRRLIFTDHTEWLKTGASLGYRTVLNDSLEVQYAYTYHFQGDGDYESRTSKIDAWKSVDSGLVNVLGVDLPAIRSWQVKQKTLPATLGLTWRRTQPEQQKLQALRDEELAIKSEIVKTNSKIFDRTVPFFYMLYPLNGHSRHSGKIAFHGVGTPNSEMELWVTGKSGTYALLGKAKCRADNGNFGILGNFAAGLWKIRMVQRISGEESKMMDYEIRVIE